MVCISLVQYRLKGDKKIEKGESRNTQQGNAQPNPPKM